MVNRPFSFFPWMFGRNGKSRGSDEIPFEVKTSQTIAVCNQKGGCGKTTTSINLAAGLALKGYPTLLIDLDPQANATLSFGLDVDQLRVTIYDLFSDPQRPLEEAIVPTNVPQLSIIPANFLLSGVQIELASTLNRENLLRQIVKRLSARFRYIILDCSPTLNLLTINALTASQYVLVPVQPHYYALEGMKELFTTIELTQERFNPDLRLLGILPVFVDGRLLIVRELLGQIRSYFEGRVLKSSIRFNSKLIEAPIAGQPIFLYARRSPGAKDYRSLTEEVLSKTCVAYEESVVKNGF